MDPTDKTTIRALTSHDLDAVVAIDAAAEGRSRRAYFQRRLETVLRQPDQYVQLGAADAGGLAGYIMGRRSGGEFGRSQPALRIEAVGVREGRLGQGIGRRLMEALANWAGRNDLTELRTTAAWNDHAMIGWLDALGFEMAPNQILQCAVADGYQAERGDELDLPEGSPAAGREVDYGAPESNDFERVARVQSDVRAMQPADLAQIVRIDREITGLDRTNYIGAKLAEAMDKSGIRVSLTARLDGAIVGYVMARADLGDFGRAEPVAVLDTIGIDPAYRHRGVGLALLSQLFANLGALKIDRIETVVAPSDFDLLGFLYRAGFKPMPRIALRKPL
jgi:ribosomal protein S18 acetylase RimI-like enzyme